MRCIDPRQEAILEANRVAFTHEYVASPDLRRSLVLLVIGALGGVVLGTLVTMLVLI